MLCARPSACLLGVPNPYTPPHRYPPRPIFALPDGARTGTLPCSTPPLPCAESGNLRSSTMYNYEGCMAMVMVAAILSMVLIMKMATTVMMLSMMSMIVKDDAIVDSRRRLEQQEGRERVTNKNLKHGGCRPHDHSTCNCGHEWWWRRSEQVLSKFRVTVVEALIVTRGACLTRVAYSNSSQP